MDYTCLMCNGLVDISIPCNYCGGVLQDLGLLQDFYDPYSPYLDQKIYQDNYKQYNAHYCVHLLHCAGCGREQYHTLKRKLH